MKPRSKVTHSAATQRGSARIQIHVVGPQLQTVGSHLPLVPGSGETAGSVQTPAAEMLPLDADAMATPTVPRKAHQQSAKVKAGGCPP